MEVGKYVVSVETTYNKWHPDGNGNIFEGNIYLIKSIIFCKKCNRKHIDVGLRSGEEKSVCCGPCFAELLNMSPTGLTKGDVDKMVDKIFLSKGNIIWCEEKIFREINDPRSELRNRRITSLTN